MNKIKKIALATVLFAAPVILCLGVASAQSFKRVVEQGEVINSSVYAAGNRVEINGTVNGDVYCAGSDITIEGTINGDVICAGQDVTIGGKVNGDIRVAGMNVTISAVNARAISAAAQNLVLENGAKISQDATLFGMTLNLKGSIGRDVTAAGQKMTVSGFIGRDVKSEVETLIVKSGSIVGGTFNYTSDTQADVSPDAKIVGGMHQTVPEHKESKSSVWGFNWMFYLYVLAALTLLSLITVLIVPKAVETAAGVATKRWGMSILAGFLSGIVIPIAMLLAGLTFIGLPLVFVTLLLWGILAAVSAPVVAFMLGRLVLRKKATNAIGVVVLGSLIAVTAYFLPFIGFLLLLVSYWLGTGATILAVKKYLPSPNYKLK